MPGSGLRGGTVGLGAERDQRIALFHCFKHLRGDILSGGSIDDYEIDPALRHVFATVALGHATIYRVRVEGEKAAEGEGSKAGRWVNRGVLAVGREAGLLGRFFLRYIWELCFAPSALLFVGLGCTIVGFVTTWFIFMYLPFREYLLPIIHSDALAGLAFSELRVLAPLMAAVLISVRNSSLITASIGHKVYSDQIKAMRNLNVPHRLYINTMVMAASGVAAVGSSGGAVLTDSPTKAAPHSV